MPTEYSPADSSAVPPWRKRLQEDIGEDPGRFLDMDLFARDAAGSTGHLLRARIRGIDRLDVLRAWIAAERRLDRGPREKVIELLEEREAELQEIGERPDRLPLGPRRPPEWTTQESAAVFIDEDGTERDQERSTFTRSRHAVATDGGESNAE